jgi:hypothetical protein
MAGNVSGMRADKTIVVPPKLKRRLESLRRVPEDPLWRVIERGLDERDELRRKSSPTETTA